jgi:hypothetical protein
MEKVSRQTISGFNEYVDTLRGDENAKRMRFSLTLFNSHEIDPRLSKVKLRDVPVLDSETYKPRGLTPLYDAIGTAISEAEVEMFGKKNWRALVVIQTDGEENNSKEYSREDIFDMIKAKQEQGWDFVFLGADQDAWLAGAKLGLHKGSVLTYASENTARTFERAATATAHHVASGKSSTQRFWEGETSTTNANS